jgi:hypothetical protein
MNIKSKKTLKNSISAPPSGQDKDKKHIVDSGFALIPSFIFRDRSVAVLESLVEYLKDVKNLSYHEIAVLLNRNDRTIWTVYSRVKKKRKHARPGN